MITQPWRGGWRGGAHGRPRALLLVPVLLGAALLLAACSVQLGAATFGATTTTGGASTINVQIMHGSDGTVLVLVPITIDGRGPYKFALDTGASITIINAPIAAQLRLPVVGRAQPIAGVAGTETATPVRVDTWQLGGVTLPASVVTSGQLASARRGNGLQGLLGSDVLSKFGTITIDYTAGTVTVYKSFAPASTPSAAHAEPAAPYTRLADVPRRAA